MTARAQAMPPAMTNRLVIVDTRENCSLDFVKNAMKIISVSALAIASIERDWLKRSEVSA